MVDVVTRFVVLKPLQTKRAVEIANRLVETFANFGVSKLLQSDNDKALVNETMEEVRKMAGFQFRNIMAYFPRQNGVVERFVEETKSLLKKVIRGDHAAWDVFIPAVQMAMNDRVLSRHGSRPFSVMFGRKMNGFDDYRKVSWDEKEGKEWLENAKKWGKDVWEAISLKGKNYGTEVCDRNNEVGLKSRNTTEYNSSKKSQNPRKIKPRTIRTTLRFSLTILKHRRPIITVRKHHLKHHLRSHVILIMQLNHHFLLYLYLRALLPQRIQKFVHIRVST